MMTATKTEIQNDEEDWLKLCEAVSHEPDPQRLSMLVEQLIQKLDVRAEALRRIREKQTPTAGDAL
jgi:ribosomal protein L12E/L44/L45/RPP1/RPP2